MDQRLFPGLFAALLLIAAAGLATASERYVEAAVDETGALRIVTEDGRSIRIPRDPDETGFRDIAIAPDGEAVGWVGMRENCCTSYPIPTRLSVYRAGARRTFEGAGLPVFEWAFQDGGGRIAFRQETVHGSLGLHYELHDVVTGLRIAVFEPQVGVDNLPLPCLESPSWVRELDTASWTSRKGDDWHTAADDSALRIRDEAGGLRCFQTPFFSLAAPVELLYETDEAGRSLQFMVTPTQSLVHFSIRVQSLDDLGWQDLDGYFRFTRQAQGTRLTGSREWGFVEADDEAGLARDYLAIHEGNWVHVSYYVPQRWRGEYETMLQRMVETVVLDSGGRSGSTY